MSGPKVVRIVTREEVIATCQGQLARLDAALAGWTKDGRRTDTVSEADIEAGIRRRDQIAALLSQDRFLELQKAVPEEIAFLKADRQERLRKAAIAEARARTVVRRQEDAATALLKALERRTGELPTEIERALSAAAKGKGDVNAALRAGFALLNAPKRDDQALQELAQRLKGDDAQRSLADWLGAQPPGEDDIELTRMETRLGELVALSSDQDVASLEGRLRRIRDGEDGARRRLLMDSLSMDLAHALSRARELAEVQEQLDEAVAELNAISTTAAAAVVEAPGQPSSLEHATSLLTRVRAEIARHREMNAAEARRRVVLEGLAALGYEVGEQLSTAWVRDGRIVLRRPAQPGYGVEVSGGASAERLQMRVVAFGDAPIDLARDRDAETLWCGDVTTLQARFAAAGSALTIDKAFPVGAVPVKRAFVEEDRSAAREGPARQNLKLT